MCNKRFVAKVYVSSTLLSVFVRSEYTWLGVLCTFTCNKAVVSEKI